MTEQERGLVGGGQMGERMRAQDWTQTPLGPVEGWSPSLRTAVSVLLASPSPVSLFWGPELVTLYNDGYVPIIGGKHPAALGVPARWVFADIWDALHELFDRVMRTGTPVFMENEPFFMDRHGFAEEAYFTFSYVPVRDEHGQVAGVFDFVNETTRQVLGERRIKALRELSIGTAHAPNSESVLRAAGERLAHGGQDVPFALLYRVEGDTARLSLRAGLKADARLAPEAVRLGDGAGPWPLTEVLRSGEERLVEDVGAHGPALHAGPWPEPVRGALLLPLALGGNGGSDAVLVLGLSPRLPLDESYHDFLRLLARQVAADVTRARALEQEKQRAEQLAELDRAKTAFFSNVSHEFRTPLTLMLGPTEAALASPERALRGEDLERVHRNELRLLKLVNTLLDFSRLEAGRARARFEPTDLAALTAGLAGVFDSVMAQAGLRLVVDCPPLPGPVWVDPDMWEKVVLNLVSNALKFTLQGGVSVRLHPRGEWVELSVQDTGTGIPAEEQPRIFERFHRVEGALGRSDEGSGIGLALVRDLVGLHGGDVSVESAPGQGSTFTVRLPTGQAHLPRAPGAAAPRRDLRTAGTQAFVHEAAQWLAPVPGAVMDPSLPALPREASWGHVLLADDNADMRGYVAQVLSRRFTVEAVADGQAALAAARARPPDLVLSDVMMPGLDGFALVRQLKADPRTAHVPVMLLSARAGEAATLEGLAAGGEDYLVKPFGARELLARVEGAVRAAQARAERERLLQEVETARGRLYQLIENAPAFVCALRGPQHVYEMINPPYQRLVGAGRPLLGLAVARALPETVEQGFIQVLDDVYRTGVAHIGRETRFLADRQGQGLEESFVDFIFQPRRDAHGQVEGIDVFGFEVTDQVRARQRAEALTERLRESEEHLRRVAESSGAGFFELDVVTGRLTADARAYNLLGLVPGSPLSLDLALACVYAEDRESLAREISTVLSGEMGEQYIVAARVVGLGQVPQRWVESRGQRRLDAHGRPVALAGALLDITARKEAEAASQALLQALGDSEERYRLATRATKDAIWDWNLVTHGVSWNEGLRELFGHGAGDVRPDGSWWVEHIHPEDRERISQSIHAVIDAPAGGHWHDEYRFSRRDGTWAFVADRGWVSRDASGKAVRMVGAMQDVTERKESEALRARQSRHHALRAQVGLTLSRGVSVRNMLQECAEALVSHLETALARVWLFNPTHQVLELQASAGLSTQLDGPHGRVAVGQYKVGFIAQERTPHLTNALLEDARLGDPQWARREGLVAFAGYPLLVGDKLVGVVAVFSRHALAQDTLDILKQVADSIAVGIERLRAESELRGRVDFEQQLIGIVSHDLRNPLGAILLGATVLAQREVLDARGTKSLLRIRSSAERATRMVKDLLDFTQARLGGGIRIEPRPTDLHEVTRGVVEEVEAAYPSRELEVRHEGEGHGTWDADRLAQVVQNLVTNALKYSPEDSRVRIVTQAEEAGVSLSVFNGGAPIPPEKLLTIFEPMQRATAEVDKTGRSVGLGLYIVRSIVDAHGGRVTVASTPAEGTVFTVRLPRQRP